MGLMKKPDVTFKYIAFLVVSVIFGLLSKFDFIFAALALFLSLILLFHKEEFQKILIICIYLSILFSSLYLFLKIEPFSDGSKSAFIFPFFVFPSTLFFLVGREFTVYFSAIGVFFGLFLFPQVDKKFLSLSFAWFFSSLLLIWGLSYVRRRMGMFKLGAIYGISGATFLFVINLDPTPSFYFVLSSLLSPMISLSIIYLYERFLGVLTPFYLFDLQDLEHPLLVQLRKKAPGTFHHSLVVADIAYVAAKEVGANAELVRCAALYHDIGKMLRPEYFFENIGNIAKHLKINPPLSSKIIIKHVEDGVKLAKSYSLPRRIIDFILEHHGTLYPEYFVKAAQLLDMKFDASYPGPTPRSIETVIMMICDSCEAAVRSLEEYTVENISERVDVVVQKRLGQGQFNNAPCTIQQLMKIKDAVKKALTDFYHLRIEYSPESIKQYSETIHLRSKNPKD